jgi:hypothetical protein
MHIPSHATPFPFGDQPRCSRLPSYIVGILVLFVSLVMPAAALAQPAPQVTMSVSATGSTLLTLTVPGNACFLPSTTSYSRAGNQLTLASEFLPNGCFPTPPATLPFIFVVDVGHLPAGTYQATWSLFVRGNPPNPDPATLSFIILSDQVPVPIPALSEYALVALIFACCVLGIARLRSNGCLPSRTRPRST